MHLFMNKNNQRIICDISDKNNVHFLLAIYESRNVESGNGMRGMRAMGVGMWGIWVGMRGIRVGRRGI